MTPKDIFDYAGLISGAVAAIVIIRAAWHINTANVWKEEAEAQRARADRLQTDMEEIKERLSRIEDENKRLIELLTALDPARIAALRN
jgi:predicted nuclease with TOPRIM domain